MTADGEPDIPHSFLELLDSFDLEVQREQRATDRKAMMESER
jgi:hypothetical protein